MGKIRVMPLVAALLLAFGLCGCSGGSPAQSGSAPSGASAGEASQPSQEASASQEAQAEDETIYPWVVAKRTATSSSGLVSEYAYEYDDAGRLASITGMQEEMVGYNERGTVRVDLSYDAESRLTGMGPGTPLLPGTVTVGYDGSGRVSDVTQEWVVSGRMPEDVGANVYATDYSYGPGGELSSSRSTHTVEGEETGTTSCEYSSAADAGYDGKATSDGTPPLVEWNDERVMAGNGVGTGATGEFDAHGNLVKVEVPGQEAVSYEYQQIEAKRGEWEPGALSNPTLRTFAWDGLSNVNYLTLFPPQLTEADAARVLEADTIAEEPAASAGAAEQEAAGGEGAPSEAVDTPGYTVSIPAEYAATYSYTMEEGNLSPVTGFAYHATVTLGAESFEVACVTADWSVQGRYASVNLGPSTAMPGWNVWLYAPIDSGVDPEAYRDLVTLK